MDKWRKETNRWQAQHWAVTPSQNRAPGWLLHGPEEANCCESGWIAQKLSRGEAVRAEYRAELDSGGGPQGPSGPGLGSTSPLESSEEREAVAREEGERWPRRFEGSGWVGREHSDGEQGVSGRSCNMSWEQLDKQGEDQMRSRWQGVRKVNQYVLGKIRQAYRGTRFQQRRQTDVQGRTRIQQRVPRGQDRHSGEHRRCAYRGLRFGLPYFHRWRREGNRDFQGLSGPGNNWPLRGQGVKAKGSQARGSDGVPGARCIWLRGR